MRVDLSIFNPSNRPLIGLDISSSSVKMVELAGDDKGGYRVERYAIEPLPRDSVVDGKVVNIEAISDSITRAWKRMGATTKYVAMALPAAAVITKKIILPANLREQEMELQVESEANQYIPFALEEVNLDFQVVGPAGMMIFLVITAAVGSAIATFLVRVASFFQARMTASDTASRLAILPSTTASLGSGSMA